MASTASPTPTPTSLYPVQPAYNYPHHYHYPQPHHPQPQPQQHHQHQHQLQPQLQPYDLVHDSYILEHNNDQDQDHDFEQDEEYGDEDAPILIDDDDDGEDADEELIHSADACVPLQDHIPLTTNPSKAAPTTHQIVDRPHHNRTLSASFDPNTVSGRVEDLFQDVALAYAEMVAWLWFDSGSKSPFDPQELQLRLHPTPHFADWIRRVISMTQLSSTVVILSLHYLWLYKHPNGNNHPKQPPSPASRPNTRPESGSEYMVAVVALMLANKVLDDNTYTNKSWAYMCSQSLENINKAEREFLIATNHSLHVDVDKLKSWKICLLGHMTARHNKLAQQAQILFLNRPNNTHYHPHLHRHIPPQPTPQAYLRNTQQQQQMRARSASPEPYQFTFTAPLPPSTHLQPPVSRRTARPVSFYATDPATNHWSSNESSQSLHLRTNGVKRSADVAFSPLSIAAPIPHPSSRARQVLHDSYQAQPISHPLPLPLPSAPATIALPRRHAPSSTAPRHAKPAKPHRPPPPTSRNHSQVEFRFSQMNLNATQPVVDHPPSQLALSHVPSLDTSNLPPLHFYQLVQGGRILRAATPANSSTVPNPHASSSMDLRHRQGHAPVVRTLPPTSSWNDHPPHAIVPKDTIPRGWATSNATPTDTVMSTEWIPSPTTTTTTTTTTTGTIQARETLTTPTSQTSQTPDFTSYSTKPSSHAVMTESPNLIIPHQAMQRRPPQQQQQPQQQRQAPKLPPVSTLLDPFNQPDRSSTVRLSPHQTSEYAPFANAGSPGFRWQHWYSSTPPVFAAGSNGVHSITLQQPYYQPSSRVTTHNTSTHLSVPFGAQSMTFEHLSSNVS